MNGVDVLVLLFMLLMYAVLALSTLFVVLPGATEGDLHRPGVEQY